MYKKRKRNKVKIFREGKNERTTGTEAKEENRGRREIKENKKRSRSKYINKKKRIEEAQEFI